MILNEYKYGKFEIKIKYGNYEIIPVFIFMVYFGRKYLWEVPIQAKNMSEAKKEFHEKIMKGESL